MFLLADAIIALIKRAVFFCVFSSFVFIFTIPLCSVTVGVVDPYFDGVGISKDIVEKLSDSIDAEMLSKLSFSSVKVSLLPVELDLLLSKKIKSEKLNNIKYLVLTTISKYVERQEYNFYDSNIIDNIIIMEGTFVILSVDDGVIVDKKGFEYNISSRVDFSELRSDMISQIALKFRKFVRELDKYTDDIEVVSGKLFFVTINKGRLDGVTGGTFLKSSGKGLIKIIKADFESSTGYVFFQNKTNQAKYYKIPKRDFEVRVFGGGSFLQDQYEKTNFYPQISAGVYIPIIPYMKLIIDSSFYFMNINGQMITPFIISTGIEGYFDLFFVSIFQDIMVGGEFSQNSSGSVEPDSFMINFSGGISFRFTSEFKILFDSGYRYVMTNELYKKHGVNISGAFIRGGVALEF